ncbi:hypothetical protein [Fervidobacterium sp.]
MGGQEEWSFLVWEERKGLLGAAALEYPEPFADLDKHLKAVPKAHVEGLGELTYMYLALEDLKRSLPPQPNPMEETMGLEAWDALSSWSKRAWPPGKVFPEKWKIWAFPLLASTFSALDATSEGALARSLAGAFLFRIESWLDPNTPREAGLPPEEPPEPLEPFMGESLQSYLKRAEAHYHAFKEWAKRYQGEVSPVWRTRNRDLLFLAWREVEELTEEEIAHRVEERIHTGHPTARYFFEGRRAESLGEDLTGSLPELIHKAIVLTRKRLRIT